jgi:cytochrome c1
MTVRRAALGVALVSTALVQACSDAPARPRWANVGGDPKQGAVLVTRYSCGACHLMPGVPNANGLVGPSLAGFARRTTIAGLLPNTPPNLVLWLRDPQAIIPGNAMPNVGLTDAQARDIAAYLYVKG